MNNPAPVPSVGASLNSNTNQIMTSGTRHGDGGVGGPGAMSHGNQIPVYPTPPLQLAPSMNSQPNLNPPPYWHWPQAALPYPQSSAGIPPPSGLCWPPPWGNSYNLPPPPFGMTGNYFNNSGTMNSKDSAISANKLQAGKGNSNRGGKSPSNANTHGRRSTSKKHGEVNISSSNHPYNVPTPGPRQEDFEISIGSQRI